MQFFDTHAHLDSQDFEGQVDQVWQRCGEAGVTDVIAVGVSADSSERCIAFAQSEPGIHAAVGIQPNDCHEAAPGDWDRVVRLARRGQAVALGETGLDCYWDRCPMEVQRDYFDRHLRLSQELDLPFIVHLRESADPILEMLQEARRRGPLRGVMHSYTADADMAREFLALGMHISFAGMVTFKKSDDLRAVARTIPDDRILIETDSPYLSPEPKRGKRPNDPSRVVYIAECLAGVRETSLSDFAAATYANATRLFLRNS